MPFPSPLFAAGRRAGILEKCGTPFALVASVRPTRLVLLTIVLFTACERAPSSSEALTLLRAAAPALDTGSVTERVWADGPPWFSCAEVLAKVRTSSDSAVIRGQLANWRPLVLANWVTLRDTAKGPVTDPGWCRVALRDSAVRVSSGWRPVTGLVLPTGDPRLGWDVPAGTRRLVVRKGARTIGKDSATVDYLVSVQPNANGVGLGADQDTTRRRALLVKSGGEWRAVQLDWSHANGSGTAADAQR
jgi:hypothetical protein